jgi:serralysin
MAVRAENSQHREAEMANLSGTGVQDTLTGAATDDSINGNGGRDTLTGGAGHDTMRGGGGNDLMSGGTGDDVMIGSQGKSAKVDLTNFAIKEDVKAKVTFDGESAGYKNTLGMYKIGADGKMYDVKILFSNASLEGSGGKLKAGVSATDFDLKAGEKVGFFVVPNAYDQKGMANLLDDAKGSWKMVDIATGKDGNVNGGHTKLVYVAANGRETDIKSQYGVDVFHSSNKSGHLNGDRYDHVKGESSSLEGKIKIGFEDLWNGGDKDFDDSVFTLEIGVNNAEALTTVRGRDARWQDNDTMDGGAGNDVMYGVAGNDTMTGGTGNDKMSGGSGNDVLSGGEGDDLLMGNSGNDRLLADAGNDRIIGGSGFDTIDFSGIGRGVTVNLAARKATGAGDDRVEGVEGVVGSAFDDVITGSKADNVLDGGAGNDVLRGGAGADVLTGGEGKDTFAWYKNDLKGGADHITDFKVGDTVDLSHLFNGIAGKHNDLVNIVDGKDGLHIQAKIGGAFVDVVTLDGVHGMTAQDMLAGGLLLT